MTNHNAASGMNAKSFWFRPYRHGRYLRANSFSKSFLLECPSTLQAAISWNEWIQALSHWNSCKTSLERSAMQSVCTVCTCMTAHLPAMCNAAQRTWCVWSLPFLSQTHISSSLGSLLSGYGKLQSQGNSLRSISIVSCSYYGFLWWFASDRLLGNEQIHSHWNLGDDQMVLKEFLVAILA